jgi:hypothetical protein
METHDEALATRLKAAETDVAREFAALDRSVVHEQFERVAGELLRSATVTDFVPVIARRQVREILKASAEAIPAAGG